MNTDFSRVIVTQDIRHVDGNLKVGKGAIGSVKSSFNGDAGILFDGGQKAHVELSGCRQLFQLVPLIHTWPIHLMKSGFGPQIA